MAPALTEIFASDTSDFAKMFASYLTPPTGRPSPPAATTTAGGKPDAPVDGGK
jgi:hypothetical protein